MKYNLLVELLCFIETLLNLNMFRTRIKVVKLKHVLIMDRIQKIDNNSTLHDLHQTNYHKI